MNRRIVSALLILAVGAGALTGCKRDTELTSEQKEWISQMEEWYPDDEFTCRGHAVGFMGSRSEGSIEIESENFPDIVFEIYERDGEIYSTYPAVYHQEAAEEFFAQEAQDALGCSRVEAAYYPARTQNLPCEYVSDDEFIEEYMENDFTLYLYYDRVSDVAQEEMVSDLLHFADDLGGDADIRVYLMSGSDSPDDVDNFPDYRLTCEDGNVNYLGVRLSRSRDPEDFIRNMTLEDALEEYG